MYPKEVENLIGHHPDVLEAAVAGIPDLKTGELVKAWVKLKCDDIAEDIMKTLEWQIPADCGHETG